jgi:3-hydroxy-9,10-secoandrosta-1,3,5(10)-triene-9,17-dione monooxygenase reductase component
MTAAGFFCVNMLAADQEQVCRDFAVSGADKFANVHWSPGKTGAPVLDGALRAIECRIELIHDAGDHELVIGRVVGFGPEASGAAGPLLFYRGGFGRFTEAGE